jgi:hypothetical protein
MNECMYVFIYLFEYFDWTEILPEEEDDDEITTSSVRAELELNDKSCVIIYRIKNTVLKIRCRDIS